MEESQLIFRRIPSKDAKIKQSRNVQFSKQKSEVMNLKAFDGLQNRPSFLNQSTKFEIGDVKKLDKHESLARKSMVKHAKDFDDTILKSELFESSIKKSSFKKSPNNKELNKRKTGFSKYKESNSCKHLLDEFDKQSMDKSHSLKNDSILTTTSGVKNKDDEIRRYKRAFTLNLSGALKKSSGDFFTQHSQIEDNLLIKNNRFIRDDGLAKPIKLKPSIALLVELSKGNESHKQTPIKQIIIANSFLQKNYKDTKAMAEENGDKILEYEDFCNEIVSHLIMERYNSWDVLLNKNDIGKKMYIIVSGTLQVMIPKGGSEIDDDREFVNKYFWDRLKNKEVDVMLNPSRAYMKKSLAENRIPRTIISYIINNWNSLNGNLKIVLSNLRHYPLKLHHNQLCLYLRTKKDQYYDNGVFLYKHVVDLEAGAAFGEQALTLNMPRNASIICKYKPVLFSLSKKNFQESFSSSIAFDLRKKRFFENFYKHIPKYKLKEIQYKYEEKKFYKNHTIFSEGDHIKFIYILTEGEISLTKIVQSNNEYCSNKEGNNCALKNNDNEKIYQVPEFLKKNSLIKPVPQIISILLPNQCIGDEEIYKKSKQWSYTAKVHSVHVKVWQIHRDNFIYLQNILENAYFDHLSNGKKKDETRNDYIKNYVSICKKNHAYTNEIYSNSYQNNLETIVRKWRDDNEYLNRDLEGEILRNRTDYLKREVNRIDTVDRKLMKTKRFELNGKKIDKENKEKYEEEMVRAQTGMEAFRSKRTASKGLGFNLCIDPLKATENKLNQVLDKSQKIDTEVPNFQIIAKEQQRVQNIDKLQKKKPAVTLGKNFSTYVKTKQSINQNLLEVTKFDYKLNTTRPSTHRTQQSTQANKQERHTDFEQSYNEKLLNQELYGNQENLYKSVKKTLGKELKLNLNRNLDPNIITESYNKTGRTYQESSENFLTARSYKKSNNVFTNNLGFYSDRSIKFNEKIESVNKEKHGGIKNNGIVNKNSIKKGFNFGCGEKKDFRCVRANSSYSDIKKQFNLKTRETGNQHSQMQIGKTILLKNMPSTCQNTKDSNTERNYNSSIQSNQNNNKDLVHHNNHLPTHSNTFINESKPFIKKRKLVRPFSVKVK